MALADTRIDFSNEDWDRPVEFFAGCWVIASIHNPGLNRAMIRPRDRRPQLPVHLPAKGLAMGGFPMSLMMRIAMPAGSFRSTLEGQPGPIADARIHAAEWQAVLDWDIRAWTSAHDPPTICDPDLPGTAIKQLVRESLARSGEDDPTGARLKWNRKHRKRLEAAVPNAVRD